jgi:hypothetical protein
VLEDEDIPGVLRYDISGLPFPYTQQKRVVSGKFRIDAS